VSRGMLLVTAAVLVGAALAVPGVSGAQTPPQDSVTGSGTANFWGPFQIDVRSGPSGENASGQASFDMIFGLVSGSISCLAVRDNVATFNIALTRFGLVTIQVTDNGLEGDLIVGLPETRAASDCSPLTGSLESFTGGVFNGGIVVVDAPPLPTSKDQCKNGDWRTYGIFRNQGDCVSFVASGP
jgi:hypothetical protein